MHAAARNADGAVRSASGMPLPPFIVLERGVTLTEWARHERKAMQVIGMVEAVADLLVALHGSGRVHRDVKPDNVLLMLHTQMWRLLDMGIVATVGASVLCIAAGARWLQHRGFTQQRLSLLRVVSGT